MLALHAIVGLIQLGNDFVHRIRLTVAQHLQLHHIRNRITFTNTWHSKAHLIWRNIACETEHVWNHTTFTTTICICGRDSRTLGGNSSPGDVLWWLLCVKYWWIIRVTTERCTEEFMEFICSDLNKYKVYLGCGVVMFNLSRNLVGFETTTSQFESIYMGGSWCLWGRRFTTWQHPINCVFRTANRKRQRSETLSSQAPTISCVNEL